MLLAKESTSDPYVSAQRNSCCRPAERCVSVGSSKPGEGVQHRLGTSQAVLARRGSPKGFSDSEFCL